MRLYGIYDMSSDVLKISSTRSWIVYIKELCQFLQFLKTQKRLNQVVPQTPPEIFILKIYANQIK